MVLLFLVGLYKGKKLTVQGNLSIKAEKDMFTVWNGERNRQTCQLSSTGLKKTE